MAQNEQEKKKEKMNRNITFMVISIDFLFLIGNLPNSIGIILQQYFDTSSDFLVVYAVIANIILFTVSGSDIFIYYSFNKLYRKALHKKA